jgi:hypothetical protein
LSSELKALADAGLGALDALDTHKPPTQDCLARWRALIAKHKQEGASSASIAGSFTSPPPQSDLLIAIVPAIETLVDAVARMAPAQ